MGSWRTRFSFVAIILILLLSKSIMTTRSQGLPVLSDLVLLSEDTAHNSGVTGNLPLGCNTVSVFNATDGSTVFVPRDVTAPGRLAIALGRRGLIAATNQSNRDIGLRFLRLDLSGVWSAREVTAQSIATMGGLAIVADGTALLASEAHVVQEANGVLPNRPPYHLARYDLPSDLPRTLGQPAERRSISDLVVEILPDPSRDVAHLITGSPALRSIDINTLQDLSAAVPLESFEAPINANHRSFEDRIHADLSRDGRFVVTGLGEKGAISVIDVVSRTATIVPTSQELGYVGGVALNKGWVNPGLLAVHHRAHVAVYEFTPPNLVSLVDSITIPTAHRSESNKHTGPKFSVAWSGSGESIIAASDRNNAEFIILDLHPLRGLTERRFIAACAYDLNFPQDIATLNGLLVPTPTASATPTNSPPTATASPTPPPTDTATPTQTPSPTPSSTFVPSPTATSTATSTPIPAPLYLPLLLGEECRPEERRAEVVMVLDASSSMLDPTAAGRSKLQAAIEAAGRLLTALDFGAGDRAGLVVFNEEVTLELSPTADPQALAEALAGIQAAPGTCIPCGLETGIDLLAASGSGGAAPERSRALLLLTDGRSTVRPIEEAIAMAQAARAEGLVIFAVGLGQDVEEPALQAIVNRPAYYYRSLDAEALTSIFETIVTQIPCPPSRFWAGR